MPRPTLPPTPAASTDITGKEGQVILQSEQAFALPPSAVSGQGSTSPVSTLHKKSIPTPQAPLSPASPRYQPIQQQQHTQQQQPARKRSSTHADGPTFETSIPPPPSRSRKIIQVEPKEQAARKSQLKDEAKLASVSTATSSSNVEDSATEAKARKKNATTSAGRKIARKTAHSLIERRRRSKMNEEFGVLKDMIPACNGQDMHKLAILQASIDYVRYLKKCVEDLQQRPASADKLSTQATIGNDTTREPTPRPRDSPQDQDMDDSNDEEDSADEDEDETQFASNFKHPVYRVSSMSSSSLSATTSPAFSAQGGYNRVFGHGGTDLPSPALNPLRDSDMVSLRHHSTIRGGLSPLHSAQPSPDIPPQSRGSNSEEEDASQALLMLNACDRRTSISNADAARPDREWAPGGRAMSVQDLLR